MPTSCIAPSCAVAVCSSPPRIPRCSSISSPSACIPPWWTGCWVLASETCALDIVGADFIRDVEPGEIVVINDQGVHSIKPFNKQKERFCVFEYIYFARPDSVMEGTPVYDARKRIGAELARESGVPADVIVPVPDSGVPAAMGYAAESRSPFEIGIIRNHY